MRKTKYLVGTFLATALLFSGCFSETEDTPAPTQNTDTQKLAGQRLTDDSGVEYTLIDNGDGTETARYDDGRSVTFRRQEDGSLDFMSGTAGLIAGLAAGYFMFHGFSSGGGTWDSARNRYTVSEPLQRRDTPTSAATNSTNQNSTARNSTTPNSTTQNSTTQNSTTQNSKVNLSKEPTASSSNAKSGFGSAGARTGGTSSAAS